MLIPDLDTVRRCRLVHFDALDSIAELGNGFNFRGKDLPPRATTYSKDPFPGAVRGFVQFDCNFLHELPTEWWVNPIPPSSQPQRERDEKCSRRFL